MTDLCFDLILTARGSDWAPSLRGLHPSVHSDDSDADTRFY